MLVLHPVSYVFSPVSDNNLCVHAYAHTRFIQFCSAKQDTYTQIDNFITTVTEIVIILKTSEMQPGMSVTNVHFKKITSNKDKSFKKINYYTAKKAACVKLVDFLKDLSLFDVNLMCDELCNPYENNEGSAYSPLQTCI